MGFWESFKESYRTARADPSSSFEEKAEAEQPFDDGSHTRADEDEALLRAYEDQLEQQRQLIEDLASDNRRLEEELKIAQRTESPKRGEDEKYRKLRRAVQKHFHPDRAIGDPLLAKRLESIFKDLKAEIDRIEK